MQHHKKIAEALLAVNEGDGLNATAKKMSMF
jgi:hypothetical protein